MLGGSAMGLYPSVVASQLPLYSLIEGDDQKFEEPQKRRRRQRTDYVYAAGLGHRDTNKIDQRNKEVTIF